MPKIREKACQIIKGPHKFSILPAQFTVLQNQKFASTLSNLLFHDMRNFGSWKFINGKNT